MVFASFTNNAIGKVVLAEQQPEPEPKPESQKLCKDVLEGSMPRQGHRKTLQVRRVVCCCFYRGDIAVVHLGNLVLVDVCIVK